MAPPRKARGIATLAALPPPASMSGCGWVVFVPVLWWLVFWWAEEFVGVVVVVVPVLAGVQEWWWDPFDAAVAADLGGPGVVVDEAVVWAAGQSEVGDVGLSAFAEVLGGVVGLAVIRGCGAAGSGAAAVAVVEDEPLRGYWQCVWCGRGRAVRWCACRR